LAAHYNLGLALREEGDLDGAIREYRQALLHDPHQAEVHTSLANALAATHDLDGAVGEYREAVRRHSETYRSSCGVTEF
jgi:Tfp pilus assembly protein PilF